MENTEKDYSHIKGWGIDADPKNEPTYPMKNYTGDDHQRINWERPALQEENVEILHSNERPGPSAVFGTLNPPSGLSGSIRRYAFRHSENEYLHWLPLLLADRVDMVEGILDDLKQGHIPNLIAERGWTAEWKYNRKALVRNVVTTAVVAGAIFYLMYKDEKSRKLGKG